MIWKYIALILVSAAVLLLPSCGHEQQLTSISIQPSTETFGAANIPVIANKGSSVQLAALGTYIHPPVTKDVTTQVTWASNTPTMVTVDPTGLITATGEACGNTLISATVTTNHSVGNISSSGAIVTGFMTATVVCFTGPTLTATFSGTGSGTITSSPSGLGCSTTCSAGFASGTTVTLTAAPNTGSTFGGWTGCDSVSGSGFVCTVNNLTASREVTVTFN
jgi:Divergent InlB B-repeat domain/Bacterial Ig-like domain (group 2)